MATDAFDVNCGLVAAAAAAASGTHLLRDVVSRRGGDPRHEVAGDEGADDHGAPAGRLLLQRVPVKVQGGQDDGHLADLVAVAWNPRRSSQRGKTLQFHTLVTMWHPTAVHADPETADSRSLLLFATVPSQDKV